MKAIKSLAIIFASTLFFTACSNTGTDGQQDQDTMDTDTLMETPPPIDTAGTDTLPTDTL